MSNVLGTQAGHTLDESVAQRGSLITEMQYRGMCVIKLPTMITAHTGQRQALLNGTLPALLYVRNCYEFTGRISPAGHGLHITYYVYTAQW